MVNGMARGIWVNGLRRGLAGGGVEFDTMKSQHSHLLRRMKRSKSDVEQAERRVCKRRGAKRH